MTHDVVRPEDYAGGPDATRNAIKKVLRSHTVAEVTDFFRGQGVELKREVTGKLFPTTDRARSVLNALLQACYDVDARLLTEHRVGAVESHVDQGFKITTSQGDYVAQRVVLSTGGLALPRTGSDGFGYTLARSLGHTVTDTWPALVPLRLPAQHWLTSLKGIALDVELTLAEASGRRRRRQAGAMLLTHFGLSGPAAMDLSRHFGGDVADHGLRLSANLCPEEDFAALEHGLLRAAADRPRSTLLPWLQERFPERLAVALLRDAARIDPATRLAQLSKEHRRALLHTLTALPLPVVADRGYEHAEVTAGGVPLGEVDLKTMESRVCPGLYLAGEILDADGRIGGYNFQWAWCTGRLAGLGAATSSRDSPRAENLSPVTSPESSAG